MNIKIITIPILLLGAAFQIEAQSDVASVLKVVEENNITLKALRKSTDAQTLGNKTDIFLDGPEIEGGYLWGKPSDLGNRTDISISQTFDFATISGMKSKVANIRNMSAEQQFSVGRKEILLQAKLLCINAIYLNKQKIELEKRHAEAGELLSIYTKRLETGDANRLEYNNARVGFSTIEGEKQLNNIEQESVIDELTSINGGNTVDFGCTTYPDELLADTFEQLYSSAEQASPELAYFRQEEEVERNMLKLMRTQNLPSVTTGYMSEKVGSEHFQGITLGIAIPLWSNKNKTAQSKAAIAAAESRTADATSNYRNRLKMLYKKTQSLKLLLDNYNSLLESSNNTSLLRKALDLGEISLYNYLQELATYYELTDKILETELNYQLTLAELTAFKL